MGSLATLLMRMRAVPFSAECLKGAQNPTFINYTPAITVSDHRCHKIKQGLSSVTLMLYLLILCNEGGKTA